MSESPQTASPKPQQAGRIRDARGQLVTQLDPVAMHLLRQRDVIDSDTLRAIVGERGVGVTVGERASLVAGVAVSLLVIGLFVWEFATGGIRGATFAKTASLIWFVAVPWLIWHRVKRARFANVAAAMLKYLRCPHCGYDLRLLPVDPADGATVCPECGSAWRLQ